MRVQDILRTKGAKLSAILPDARRWSLSAVEHDPEKWTPVFGRRSCSNKKLKRDDDSKKSEWNGSVGNRRCHFRLFVNTARHPAMANSPTRNEVGAAGPARRIIIPKRNNA